MTDGWNLRSHYVMPLGSNPLQPIRCCLAKGSRLWVGYWNRVHVVDMDSRKVEVRNRRGTCIVCVSCSHLSWNSLSLLLIRPHSKHSQSLNAASSRFVSSVLVEAVFGHPADLTQSSDCSTGPQDGHYRKLISLFWSPKH